ncbi:HNH endonuclease domain-containing protein [Thiohalobacter sp. COW1]|uniref:HNH endonuclease domain-containing protein n=1 Tax=Thiohalobacter sp. COW1 TaxID=2795687 RepID=UPI001915C2F7|nr:HNH endonuclease domain-containing protein [Thiohalobacter sp. COW1]
MISINLPESDRVNIGALSALFRQRTNSYKYLFFIALLRHTQRSSVDLKTLGVEMLSIAWYPHVYFHLSFGIQDKIGKALDRLNFSSGSRWRAGRASSIADLRQAIHDQWEEIDGDRLLRFVPQRLLTPFFATELHGKRDSVKDKLIQDLAEANFNSHRPLYRFCKDGNSIILHRDWHRYLARHASIIEGWAHWHWVKYLQACNPNAPAIPEKLSPPSQRSQLKSERKFWHEILKLRELRCIYSGKVITPGDFHLDHFIPWSYVCHDRPWNLIPTIPEVNTRKGDSLPDRRYISQFVEHQALALDLGMSILKPDQWQKFIEPYILDLGLAHDSIQDEHAIQDAYSATIEPLISLAGQIGFQSNWVYPA